MREHSDLFFLFGKAALLFLAVYLYQSLRLAPFGDEAWDWNMVDRSVYIAAGRPGLAAYLSMFAGHGVPFAYCVGAAVFFAASICTQLSLFQIKGGIERFSYIAVQLGVIQFSYVMVDSFLADAVMLGIFLVSLSLWLIIREQRKGIGLAAAIICAAAAASVYQLLLLIIPVLYLVYMLFTREEEELRTHITRGLTALGVCVAATILYQCTRIACLGLVSQSVIDQVNQYQESLVTWGQLDIITHVLHIGKQWCMHLIGAGYPGEYLYATVLIPVLILTAGIFRDRRISPAERLFYGILPMAAYVLPFLPMAALGEDQGARLYLAEPLACAGLWVLLVRRKGWENASPGNWAVCALSLLVLLKACYMVSDIAFYQHRIFNESQTAYVELKNRIAQVENQEGLPTGTAPVVISGQWQSELRKVDRFNSCIINPSDAFFYSFIGDRRVKRISEMESNKEDLAALLKTMPAWPERGSVVFYNGEIIVKFDSKRKRKED